MQTINLETLAHVTGGAGSSSSSAVTSALQGVTSELQNLKYSQNNQSGGSNLLLPIALLAMNKRNQSSVVSTPGATVVTG